MKKTKLAKAIGLAIAGAALAAGSVSTASASTTMYNVHNAFSVPTPTDGAPLPGGGSQDNGTDGWVYGFQGAPSAGIAGFVGIGGSSTVQQVTPFSYSGGGIVNWGIQLTDATDSGVISQADSAKYGTPSSPFYADIDTAKGAWSDAGINGASGWRHNTDYGLFQSTVATDVNLNIQGLTQSGTQFGFTIFKGTDTSTVAYSHHGAWNGLNNTQPGAPTNTVPNPAYNPALPTSTSNPLNITGSVPGGGTTFTAADIVAYSIGGATPSNLNNITFKADAGQVYTIVLAGYRNGAWGNTADGYVLNVAAVPIPGAVWLFGSAMAGLIGVGRRKIKSAA